MSNAGFENLSPANFKAGAQRAIEHPETLGGIIPNITLLHAVREIVMDKYPEFADARQTAAQIKDHVLNNLSAYLQMFEDNVRAAGGHVHYARDGEEACQIILDLCASAGAKTITRSKSMVGEELGLPEALDNAGYTRVETDLGEHILQLAEEPPSHIVGPAFHKSAAEVSALFEEHHTGHPHYGEPPEMVAGARHELRAKFLAADVGITGANFLVADSGTAITVTNEGNAELTAQRAPKMQIVTTGIEKLVPRLEHASVFIRLLARSAVAAEISQYTTFYTGPKRAGEEDGPEAFHIVLVDNGRTGLLNSKRRDMLRCIRCGACMNHCPVYETVGGHAYGSIYPGPMGSVWTPAIQGIEVSKELPQACTLNGRCQEVCPVDIPLPNIIRFERERAAEASLSSMNEKAGFTLWGWVATRPTLYRLFSGIGVRALRLASKGGWMRRVPLLGGWQKLREFPAPEGKTFFEQYVEREDD